MPGSAAEMRKPRRYRSLLWRWTRQLWARPESIDLSGPPMVAPGQVSITRVGHSTVLIRYWALSILCDPVLTRTCCGMKRIDPLGIDSETLSNIDVVVISSLEPDHLHPPSLAKIPRTATVVLPRGGASHVTSLGFDRVLELAPGAGFGHRSVNLLTHTGTHESNIYTIGGDGPSVVFAGATGMCDSFAAIGETLRPDVALLPIGGYLPSSFRKRHLSPVDAVNAFESLHARVLVPHRYGAFALSYETLEDPERWLAALVAERGLERYVEAIDIGFSRLFVPPRGRARTQHGAERRPLGIETLLEHAAPLVDENDENPNDLTTAESQASTDQSTPIELRKKKKKKKKGTVKKTEANAEPSAAPERPLADESAKNTVKGKIETNRSRSPAAQRAESKTPSGSSDGEDTSESKRDALTAAHSDADAKIADTGAAPPNSDSSGRKELPRSDVLSLADLESTTDGDHHVDNLSRADSRDDGGMPDVEWDEIQVDLGSDTST